MRLIAFTRRGEDGQAGASPGASAGASGGGHAGGVGILTDEGIYDLTRAALYWNADPDRPVLRHLRRDVSLLIHAGADRLAAAVDLLSGGSGADEVQTSFPLIPFDSVDLRAPLLAPGKIICVGLNYRDHCREQGVFPPTKPVIFGKFANAISDPGAPVLHPAWTSQLDFECELAVVIGSTASRVAPEQALDHVFGYTILNDVTARDAQKSDRQWLRAKGADGFAPLGPAIVTADEITDPHALGIGSSVNGDIAQYSSTSEMVFSVPELVSFVSQAITLEPGDVIATGTPAGVGHYQTPPRYLKPGDVVRCEIEGIGVLENHIVDVASLAGPAPDAALPPGEVVLAEAAAREAAARGAVVAEDEAPPEPEAEAAEPDPVRADDVEERRDEQTSERPVAVAVEGGEVAGVDEPVLAAGGDGTGTAEDVTGADEAALGEAEPGDSAPDDAAPDEAEPDDAEADEAEAVRG